MKASVGDRIVIASSVLDRRVREGTIIEVRHEDGTPPFLVEWADSGRQGLIFPGPEAHVVPAEHERADGAASIDLTSDAEGASATAATGAGHVATWHVDVHLFEAGDDTEAHAVLLSGGTQPIDADGHARRRHGDFSVPEIGDELAAGRALRKLADRLIAAAATDIAAVEGHPVMLAE